MNAREAADLSPEEQDARMRLDARAPSDSGDRLIGEVTRLRGLLGEAAWYVDHYGDSRKDFRYYKRFKAAAEGKPEPTEDELYGSDEE